jgi:DNA-binding response OmpR family regulator
LLLIEDHDGLGDYLEERLSEWMDVSRVRSATEAWSILGAGTVAVVLADVVLPGESGLELCRKLRADLRHGAVPVVLMSARSAIGDRREGFSAGAAAWLGKPFSFEQLLTVVQQVWPAVAETASKRRDAQARAMDDPLVAAAMARLPDSTFGVSTWADAVHLSERQLRRRVVELTGTAPQAWLRDQRLELVRQLVRTGQCRTLAQAGARAGFDNADYLYRLYRARYGQQSANGN